MDGLINNATGKMNTVFYLIYFSEFECFNVFQSLLFNKFEVTFLKNRKKLNKFKGVSINSQQELSEEYNIDNVNDRQQRPKNNVEHEMLADVIDKVIHQSAHHALPLNRPRLFGACRGYYRLKRESAKGLRSYQKV